MINISNLEISDFFAQLKLKDSVDIWISDPPYPINTQNGTSRMKFVNGIDGLYSRLSYSDLEKCYLEMYNQSNPGASCYIFTNRDGLFETKPAMERAGWIFKQLIVWDKRVMGMGYMWRNQIEYIVYCTKGQTKRYVTKVPNFFSIKKPKGTSSKPPEIYETILKQQLRQNDVCCDPFAGSDPLSQALNSDAVLLGKIRASYSNIYQGATSVI